MKKLIALLLVAAIMCCTLAGCGGLLTKAVLGKVAAQIDVSKLLDEMLDIDITQFISGDATSVDGAMEDVVAGLQETLYGMLEQKAAQLGIDVNVEDMLAASGTSVEQILEDLMDQMNLPELVEEAISENAE